jgi:hypothetical protein
MRKIWGVGKNFILIESSGFAKDGFFFNGTGDILGDSSSVFAFTSSTTGDGNIGGTIVLALILGNGLFGLSTSTDLTISGRTAFGFDFDREGRGDDRQDWQSHWPSWGTDASGGTRQYICQPLSHMRHVTKEVFPS